jgi:hypothetical protein
VALALTPQRSDRVVLAVHAAPLARARLTVVRGAARTSGLLLTDAAGFGYARLRLGAPVVPAALRVRVESGRRTLTLKPWLSPGWLAASWSIGIRHLMAVRSRVPWLHNSSVAGVSMSPGARAVHTDFRGPFHSHALRHIH